MKDKHYDPARHNEEAPAEGMASVNTHNPEEKRAQPQTGNSTPVDEVTVDLQRNNSGKENSNSNETK